MKKFVFLYLGVAFALLSCSSDDDGIRNPGTPNPNPSADVDVQNFMWQAMNLWYFWQEEVADLADGRFANDDEYTQFLEDNTNPEDFFFGKLLFTEDRFSFLSDDYTELVQNFAGISKSNGLEFGLIQFSDSDDVFGYVRYIVPNSDASTKAIARGDIFVGVNGTTLTGDNFEGLLFGGNDTYTLNMADIAGDVVTPNGNEVTLTKQEGLVENPVFITKSFDISGQKIGYIMYNGFTDEFDEQLNAAFGQLKTSGVTDLVLDMRYNPGGNVNTSRLLASMIYDTNTSELYIKQRWNDKVQPQLSANQLEDYFAATTESGTAINTLNLSRVYILATNSSASASELVMNGLDPYIEVIHIGETTRGKNEFSITMVDDAGNNYVYNSGRENNINPQNSWAIQPLVGRNENSVGFLDYTAGFAPDVPLEEDLANLGVLGDANEPLLAKAIEEITGVTSKRDFTVKMPIKIMSSSKMYTAMKDNMYLDKPISIK
ncbi:S41 family peptidase [Spongiimicrobium sp. 3-5]|uniref:S41 family peptidase n=1 Tax=Spongiimicrobium sp. 3-5 TaxID=3332596 RepID=UPI00397F0FF5